MISTKQARRLRSRTGLGLLLTVFLLRAIAGAVPLANPVFFQRATAEYQATQARWQTATNVSPAGWQFARACYTLADFATNDENRANLAVQGIEASRKLLKAEPRSGPGHYWLGMNLGQLARTELLGALSLVREMEAEFKTAWTLDPAVDYAGAARSLGLLYREAPGWPTSIGSNRKAREWLDRAARTAPNFPENWLVLTESYVAWDEPQKAREQLQQLAKIWPAAHTNFTGVAWEPEWADWNTRRTAAEVKLAQTGAPTKAPRQTD